MKYVIIIIGLLFSTNISSQIVATMYGGVGGSTLYIGLVAAWGLNEASGTIYDYTTNNYDGTATNTPTFGATGKVGDAISFAEGSSEYINFGTSFWDPGISDLTVAAWVSVVSSISNQGIVGNHTTAPYWYLHINHVVDKFYGVVNFGPGNIETISNNAIAVDGTWYHVIYELDRDGNASIYVNNVLQTDQDDISGSVAVNLANSNTHAIGQIGSAVWYMDGTIDAVQVWSRLLTSDERAELYNSGNGWEP